MEISAVIFVLIGLAFAYFVFRILKKTVRMALRALIVLMLIVFTLGGGAALWYYQGDAPVKNSSRKR
jgi:hypothetical protein